MKCNYVRRSESNQTAEQTEENFAERATRECESERISDSGFSEMKSAAFRLFINSTFSYTLWINAIGCCNTTRYL